MAVAAVAASLASAQAAPLALDASFKDEVQPFLQRNCLQCHNADTAMSGIRLDQLDAELENRHLRLWEAVGKRVENGTMPPTGAPQPDIAERERMVAWIERALDFARSRPAPKNGVVRRLTVSQYRNTLRELLLLEDNLTGTLPPDAISEDGFVNNVETLQLSPRLVEAYFEIAEEALDRSIVDPDRKPRIQNFRVDLGASVNPQPLPEKLILGANSQLLENRDYAISQPAPSKPFAFEPLPMRTKYRFIEGYRGNATVRGWRDFDSIYHAVFAGMRGSKGYPKGNPYDMVPEGLLLRPAIPTDEIFQSDGTYGPKANFKISLRELPDEGRFRVTVTAAKYDDGLLLDPSTPAQEPGHRDATAASDPRHPRTVTIKKAGIYQIDIYEAPQRTAAAADPARLEEGLVGAWTFETEDTARLEGDAKIVDSPFGRSVELDGSGDAVVAPRDEGMGVGAGDFTVAAWIRPRQLRKAGIVALGGSIWSQGWYLDMPTNKGALRIETAGPDTESNGGVISPPGIIHRDTWQHVAAVVRREPRETRLYVNGYPVAKGTVGGANLSNPDLDLHIGRVPEGTPFRGALDDVRVYRRALDESELLALVRPGEAFVVPPPDKPQVVTLLLDGREFSADLQEPAFVVARLEAGPLRVTTRQTGVRDIARVVFTPLAANDELARRFEMFEQRVPRVGVHLGLRRDCGSTLVQVGTPRTVSGDEFERFAFEGAISDFPSPEVEKNNVNYLAGIREIAVRSEYTDGRDMPRLLVKSVNFEGPLYETWPPASHRSIFFESDNDEGSTAYAREVLRRFASRAYRRPASSAEVSGLMKVFEEARAAGNDFRASVREALLVALTSPQFLFLIENSSTPDPEPVADRELASKLAYFLWNGPPDQKTLQLAASGALRRQLDTEADRLIDDERFGRFATEFASQWLDLERFDVLEPDRERFPKLTRAARAHLRREPVEFLQYLIRNNLPARHLIESDFVLANEVVADYYDLGDRTEDGFGWVPIRHDRPGLGGILTQAAILAGLSDGRESNPVKRGTWLARRIVAEPPDPPPPNVPDLAADTAGLSLRERLEMHRSQPGCLQCHMKIDPWGVPFEEYDAGGRMKNESVDARSTLPDGTEVAGVGELKRYLAADRIDQVAFSVLKHLLTYANGRSLEYSELAYLKQDATKLRADGYRMRSMMRYVVSNRLFLEK